MKKHRFLLGLASASTLLAFLVGCSEFSGRIGSITNEAPESHEDLVIHNYQAEMFEGRTKTWKLYGKTAKVYEANYSVLLDDIKIRTYDHRGRFTSSITAKNASINQLTEDVTLRNGVVIVSSNKTRITGDLFVMHHKEQMITSPKKVTIQRANGDIVSGIGFQADSDFDNITFKSNVSGRSEME